MAYASSQTPEPVIANTIKVRLLLHVCIYVQLHIQALMPVLMYDVVLIRSPLSSAASRLLPYRFLDQCICKYLIARVLGYT